MSSSDLQLPRGHLILNGFMATGKSTVGPIVAEKLGLRFIDLDDEIEHRAGKSVGQIFADDGESGFRQLETETLRDVLNDESSVVAGGGGILQDDFNRRIAEATGLIVTLTCSVEESVRRMESDGDVLRPVGLKILREGGLDGMRRLIEHRAFLYDPYPAIATDAVAPLRRLRRRSPPLFLDSAAEIVAQLMSSRFPGDQRTTIVLGPRSGGEASDNESQVALVTDTTVDALYSIPPERWGQLVGWLSQGRGQSRHPSGGASQIS